MEHEEKAAPPRQNAGDHLANERTLLAWVRTGIGIMAFGFVVVKFSLFVRQIGLVLGTRLVVHQHGYSSPIGILLVATGAASLLLALLRYNRTRQQLLRGDYRTSPGLLYGLVALVLLVSAILIVYLLSTT